MTTYLGVKLVHNEMTEGGFEEVLFGTVFEQWVVHRVGSNLHMPGSDKLC